MIPNGYTEALAQYAATHPDGCQLIQDELDATFELVKKGESGNVTSCSVNSHSFTFQGALTVEEKFKALQEAHKQCQCLVGEGESLTEDVHGASFNITH